LIESKPELLQGKAGETALPEPLSRIYSSAGKGELPQTAIPQKNKTISDT